MSSCTCKQACNGSWLETYWYIYGLCMSFAWIVGLRMGFISLWYWWDCCWVRALVKVDIVEMFGGSNVGWRWIKMVLPKSSWLGFGFDDRRISCTHCNSWIFLNISAELAVRKKMFNRVGDSCCLEILFRAIKAEPTLDFNGKAYSVWGACIKATKLSWLLWLFFVILLT